MNNNQGYSFCGLVTVLLWFLHFFADCAQLPLTEDRCNRSYTLKISDSQFMNVSTTFLNDKKCMCLNRFYHDNNCTKLQIPSSYASINYPATFNRTADGQEITDINFEANTKYSGQDFLMGVEYRYIADQGPMSLQRCLHIKVQTPQREFTTLVQPIAFHFNCVRLDRDEGREIAIQLWSLNASDRFLKSRRTPTNLCDCTVDHSFRGRVQRRFNLKKIIAEEKERRLCLCRNTDVPVSFYYNYEDHEATVKVELRNPDINWINITVQDNDTKKVVFSSRNPVHGNLIFPQSFGMDVLTVGHTYTAKVTVSCDNETSLPDGPCSKPKIFYSDSQVVYGNTSDPDSIFAASTSYDAESQQMVVRAVVPSAVVTFVIVIAVIIAIVVFKYDRNTTGCFNLSANGRRPSQGLTQNNNIYCATIEIKPLLIPHDYGLSPVEKCIVLHQPDKNDYLTKAAETIGTFLKDIGIPVDMVKKETSFQNWRDYAESIPLTTNMVILMSSGFYDLCDAYFDRSSVEKENSWNEAFAGRNYECIPCILLSRLKQYYTENPNQQKCNVHILPVFADDSSDLLNKFWEKHRVLKDSALVYKFIRGSRGGPDDAIQYYIDKKEVEKLVKRLGRVQSCSRKLQTKIDSFGEETTGCTLIEAVTSYFGDDKT